LQAGSGTSHAHEIFRRCMTRRNRPPPASVRSPKRSHSCEGSEKPQGRRVGSRVDPARGLVHKSIRNVEAGSSGCRQHRTARHGQRTLKGTKPQGRRLLSFGRQRRRDAISDPLPQSKRLNRNRPTMPDRCVALERVAAHHTLKRNTRSPGCREHGNRVGEKTKACRDGLRHGASPSQ